jgi:hypothetical protein
VETALYEQRIRRSCAPCGAMCECIKAEGKTEAIAGLKAGPTIGRARSLQHSKLDLFDHGKRTRPMRHSVRRSSLGDGGAKR